MEEEIKQIELHGLSQVAKRLTSRTGENFYPQRIQNWRKRGVPHKWRDAFCAEFNIEKREHYS